MESRRIDYADHLTGSPTSEDTFSGMQGFYVRADNAEGRTNVVSNGNVNLDSLNLDDVATVGRGDHDHPFDDIIPPFHDRQHRTVVLCFDGTGDQFDSDNSNIVQFFSMLKKDDRTDQLVYYQAGIGTYTIPQIATPWMANLDKTIDMMVGSHLNAHVMDGYKFLMRNYQAGDKICLFGFSRGAYTARALAGMIHKVGLLPVDNEQQIPFAYHMYCQDDEEGWRMSRAFKKAFSINVDIEFIGVWDTVDSVGLVPRRLPFTKSSDNIKFFRHALSLDERRVRFKPSHWKHPEMHEHHLGVKKHEMPRSKKKEIRELKTKKQPKKEDDADEKKDVKHDDLKAMQKARLEELEHRFSTHNFETDVEEVWFAGCHCDVGGGSVKNGTRNSLARIPLRWMLREIFKCNIGIQFHRDMFYKVGMDPDTLYPYIKPRPPPLFQDPILAGPEHTHELDMARDAVRRRRKTADAHLIPIADPHVVDDDPTVIVYSDGGGFVNEEEEDLADALSPMYDQLAIAPEWWLLEMVPQRRHYMHDRGAGFFEQYSVNMGSGRNVPDQFKKGIKLHRTVLLRMEAEGFVGGKYWPKARFAVKPTWVD